MTNEDGSCWIVFNGEIYNHHGLRERLEQRGHVFRTKSDTECIVHAYEEFGTACVEHFEGMFAFAVYDTRQARAVHRRDRLGKKPLFYAELRQARCTSPARSRRCAQSPAWDPATRSFAARGLPVARLRAGAGDDLPPRPQAAARPLAARHDGSASRSGSTGTSNASTTTGSDGELVERNRRDHQDRGPRSPGKRGAARRLPVGRHRLRSRRVLHGRGARPRA